jgi:hypothetical protein
MVQRSRVLVALFVTVGATVLLSGCAVEPKEWTRSVCGALATWRKQITDLNTRAQQQMAGAKTPVQTQKNLVTLLTGAEAASETARKAVDDAGEPDVDHGEDIAKQFITSLSAVRDAYAHASRDIQALPTTDSQDFYDGVVKVITRLNQEYAASALDTKKVNSVELRKALDENPECQ